MKSRAPPVRHDERGSRNHDVFSRQSFTVLSSLLVASHFPSGLNATDHTSSECSASACCSAPSLTRQSRTVGSFLPFSRSPAICFHNVPRAPFSRPPVASHWPSGLKATLYTWSVPPV